MDYIIARSLAPVDYDNHPDDEGNYMQDSAAQAIISADAQDKVGEAIRHLIKACTNYPPVCGDCALATECKRPDNDVWCLHDTAITIATQWLKDENSWAAKAQAEAAKWEDEYHNLCKFANQYEAEAERLRELLRAYLPTVCGCTLCQEARAALAPDPEEVG